jgi:crossover junction endodeoxyribonuclease RuvC
MIKLLLGLERAPSPHDAADALAVALCHVHRLPGQAAAVPARGRTVALTSWRAYRPAVGAAASRPAARRGTGRP